MLIGSPLSYPIFWCPICQWKMTDFWSSAGDLPISQKWTIRSISPCWSISQSSKNSHSIGLKMFYVVMSHVDSRDHFLHVIVSRTFNFSNSNTCPPQISVLDHHPEIPQTGIHFPEAALSSDVHHFGWKHFFSWDRQLILENFVPQKSRCWITFQTWLKARL
jgi:hypothetical protein